MTQTGRALFILPLRKEGLSRTREKSTGNSTPFSYKKAILWTFSSTLLFLSLLVKKKGQEFYTRMRSLGVKRDKQR